MKKFLLSILLASLSTVLLATNPFDLKLYPNGVAESNNLTGEITQDDYGRIGNVSDPIVTVYLPDHKVATGQAVVVCPGGGYSYVSSKNEGLMPAQWLVARGIAAIVLRYRMPNGHNDIPIKDALTAIELVRTNAGKWNINPAEVGIMGFSAGGHLASTAITHFTNADNRPDFGILVYPVITLDERYTHVGTRTNLIGKGFNAELVELYSNEKQVKENTPPTFIAHCTDDRTVPVKNATMMYDALVAQKITTEMHIYTKGGHGWGFRENKLPYFQEFSASLGRWLTERHAEVQPKR